MLDNSNRRLLTDGLSLLRFASLGKVHLSKHSGNLNESRTWALKNTAFGALGGVLAKCESNLDCALLFYML